MSKSTPRPILDGDRLLPVDTLIARWPGTSRRTILTWVRQGKLPATKLGKRIYFRRDDVLDFEGQK